MPVAGEAVGHAFRSIYQATTAGILARASDAIATAPRPNPALGREPAAFVELSEANVRAFNGWARNLVVWGNDRFCWQRGLVVAAHINEVVGRGVRPDDDVVAGALGILQGPFNPRRPDTWPWGHHVAALASQRGAAEPRLIDHLTSPEALSRSEWAGAYSAGGNEVSVRSPFGWRNLIREDAPPLRIGVGHPVNSAVEDQGFMARAGEDLQRSWARAPYPGSRDIVRWMRQQPQADQAVEGVVARAEDYLHGRALVASGARDLRVVGALPGQPEGGFADASRAAAWVQDRKWTGRDGGAGAALGLVRLDGGGRVAALRLDGTLRGERPPAPGPDGLPTYRPLRPEVVGALDANGLIVERPDEPFRWTLRGDEVRFDDWLGVPPAR